MDYVLFGMGYGATLMLLGWALRTFGPERKYKDIDPQDIDRVIEQRRWIRFIQGLGGVIAIAGTAMVLFTFVIMLVNPDDETGAFTALVIWGFLALAIMIWCWFYVSHFGLTGIWSRESGYGFWGAKGPEAAPQGDPVYSVAREVPEVDTAEGHQEQEDDESALADADVSAESDSSRVSETDADDEVPADEPLPVEIYGPTLEESIDEEEQPTEPEPEVASSDAEYDFGDSSDTTVPRDIGGRAEAIRRLRQRQSQSGDSTT